MIDLAHLRQTVEGRTETPHDLPLHLKAFTWWMRGQTGWEQGILDAASAAIGAARLPDHAAAAGFAWRSRGMRPPEADPIRDCLAWLAERRYFLPSRPLTLERDGVAVLGLSLAVWALADAAGTQSWLEGFITKALESLPADTWDGSLMSAALIVLNPAREAVLRSGLKGEIAVALCERRLIGSYVGKGEAAVQTITRMEGLDEGPVRAAVLLVALDRLLKDNIPARLANVEVKDICRIVQGLPRAMKRWAWDEKGKTPLSAPGRWNIENEYHLQSLLWAIFAPIFDDLDDEEYLKSIGPLKPRCDLAIPSLSLIIEAKFIRPGTSFAKVIGEIAEDVTIYLRSDTPWRHLIAVVWDDGARTEDHHEFLTGLRGIGGIVDAVVIPRPSKMRRETVADTRKRQRK
jgi:hypothetical protein